MKFHRRFLPIVILLVILVMAVVWWVFFSITSPLADVRLSRVEKIKDDDRLQDLVFSHEEMPVRMAAVQRIRSEEALMNLFGLLEYRLLNLEKSLSPKDLSNELAIADIVFNKLRTPLYIKFIAEHSPIWSFRLRATEKITDQIFLRDLLKDEAGIVEFRANSTRNYPEIIQACCTLWERDLTKLSISDIIYGKISNPFILAEIAISSEFLPSRKNHALEQLLFSPSIPQSTEYKTNILADFFQTLELVRNAGRNLPDPHRERIMRELIPLIREYTNVDWRDNIGILQEFKLGWFSRTQAYNLGRLNGETVRYSAIFSTGETTSELSGYWTSEFPFRAETSQTWQYAEFVLEEAYIPLLIPFWTGTPGKIHDIALNSKSSLLRFKAAEYVKDQVVMSQIALHDADKSIRKYAVEHVTEQAVLQQVAREEEDYSIRKEAVRIIQDQEILSQIARQDENPWVRLEAAKKITSPAFLGDVLIKDLHPGVRIEAIKKIHDDQVLFQVVKEDPDKSARMEACKRIENQEILADIVLTSGYPLIRAMAVTQLNSREMLIKVARSPIFWTANGVNMQKAVIEKLNDQETLSWITLNSRLSSLIRYEAVQWLDDDTLLKNVVDKAEITVLQNMAAARLKSQDIILNIVEDDNYNLALRQRAMTSLNDPEILTSLILNPVLNESLRVAAVRKMVECDKLKLLQQVEMPHDVAASILERTAELDCP